MDKPKMARPLAQIRQGRRDWYRIANHAAGPADVWIYDEIGYWGITASDFVRDLGAVEASEITLHLNSPGGDVFDGIAILTALRDHPARVTVKVDALAASAASFIAQAGDRIVMARQAQMMIHDASGLCIGNASDMTEMAGMLDRLSDTIASVYNDRAGGGVKTWRKAMQAETWYSADEAVAAGLADEVAPLPAQDEATALAAVASWDLSIYRHAGRENAPTPSIPGDLFERPLANPAPATGGVVAANLQGEPGVPGMVLEISSGGSRTDDLLAEILQGAIKDREDAPPDPELPALDPDAFRAAVKAAAELPFDPDYFRSVIAEVALNAPAGSAAATAATPEPPAPQETAPEPEPEPEPPFDLAVFRAAIGTATSDLPALPDPPPAPAQHAEPDFTIDRTAFVRAIREARL